MKRVCFFAILVAAFAQSASAAHVDIVPYFTGRTSWLNYNEVPTALKTGTYDLAGAEGEMVDPDDRVLTGTAVNYATGPGWVSTIDPGWTSPVFDNFEDASDKYPAGTFPVFALGSLSYNVVVDSQLGRNLAYWDGTGVPSFGPVPAGEVLRIGINSQEVTLDGSATPLQGTTIQDSVFSGEFHTHWAQRLWGSESSDPGDMPTEGFYLFSANAQVNSTSIGDMVSEPFYVIMAHGFGKYDYVDDVEILAPEMQVARNWVQNNLVSPVPEPSSLLLVVGAALLCPSLRFRNRSVRHCESRKSRGGK